MIVNATGPQILARFKEDIEPLDSNHQSHPDDDTAWDRDPIWRATRKLFVSRVKLSHVDPLAPDMDLVGAVPRLTTASLRSSFTVMTASVVSNTFRTLRRRLGLRVKSRTSDPPMITHDGAPAKRPILTAASPSGCAGRR